MPFKLRKPSIKRIARNASKLVKKAIGRKATNKLLQMKVARTLKNKPSLSAAELKKRKKKGAEKARKLEDVRKVIRKGRKLKRAKTA